MIASIRAIKDYVGAMDFEDFVADRKTVDAVVRNLIIIGEAACHVPDDICGKHPEIPLV